MGNDNKVKNIVLTVLVIGLVSMTIAYAALTQTLVINDNQVTLSTDWSVHFSEVLDEYGDPVGATTTSTGSAYKTALVDTQPTLTATRISGIRATFRKPGDKLIYDFDIVNDGGIDATLSSATYDTPICTSTDSNVSEQTLSTFCSNKIHYSIVYKNTSTAPAQGDDLLTTGDTSVRHCTLTVELDQNTEVADIPAGDITISNIGATFIYVQK